MKRVDHFTCEEAFQRLDDYIDRELTPHEMHQIAEHLEIYVQCTEEFAFETDALERIRMILQRIRIPHDLMAAISSAITKDQAHRSEY